MNRHFLAAAIVLAAIVGFIATAEGKEPSKAPKVTLCETTDLYFGPVSSDTRSVRLGEVCKAVSVKSATKKIEACAAEGAESCEVILSADPKDKRITLEHKIQVSASGEK